MGYSSFRFVLSLYSTKTSDNFNDGSFSISDKRQSQSPLISEIKFANLCFGDLAGSQRYSLYNIRFRCNALRQDQKLL